MRLEFDIRNRAGFVIQGADQLYRLSTTSRCEDSINDDIPLQVIVHDNREPGLFDFHANGFPDLEEQELFKVFQSTQKDVYLPYVAGFGKEQRPNSPGARLDTSVTELELRLILTKTIYQ